MPKNSLVAEHQDLTYHEHCKNHDTLRWTVLERVRTAQDPHKGRSYCDDKERSVSSTHEDDIKSGNAASGIDQGYAESQ